MSRTARQERNYGEVSIGACPFLSRRAPCSMLLQDDSGRALAAEWAVLPRPWEAGVWMNAGRPDLQGRASSELSRWRCPLTYVQEQTWIFEIDWVPWLMELGVRWQAWTTSVDSQWMGPLRSAMGAALGAPALVFDLWHARAEVLPGDMQGALALMVLGRDAVLWQGDISFCYHGGRWYDGLGAARARRRMGMCLVHSTRFQRCV